MDRLELIKSRVDALLDAIQNKDTRKLAYLHLYSTSQFATMLAINKKLNIELCAIAAILHDISLYAFNSGHLNHASESGKIARDIVEESALFTDEEVEIIVHAIEKHSNKQCKLDGLYAEVLKDADVLSHYLYNVNIPIPEQDKVRLYYLLEYIQLEREK